MKNLIILILSFVCYFGFSQEDTADLGDFKMSNDASPAFLLLEESPTSIYAPNNLKAMAIHGLNNFGESLSIELTPYFFLGTKKTNRTYYKYIGIEKDSISGKIKQDPFRGLNTTNISIAYVDKDFEGIDGNRKTFSIGIRTTLLRFYNKTEVYNNAINKATALAKITIPLEVLEQDEEDGNAIKNYTEKKFDEFQKTFGKGAKPIFRLDGAIAYSALFKENSISSGTANRFGSWLTAEGSLLLNKNGESSSNNYINVFLTARYITDGFNADSNNDYFNRFYRDFGGKIEFEFGKIAFAYEFISRRASITSERSVGTIKFTLNKDVSFSGGFGKDFPADNNLITVFGINYGLNMGKSKVSVK